MAETYSDLNARFPTESLLVTDVDDVFESLYNIFSTDRGERFFNPEITADFDSLLFHELGVSDDAASEIYAKMLFAIERHEPRVRIVNSQSSVRPNDEGDGFIASFTFEVRGLEGQFRFDLRVPAGSAQ